MKVITNPHYKLPKNPKSHTLGWTMHWAFKLGAEINHDCDQSVQSYSKVYIDHGVNFGGNLNLFGGANDEVYRKFSNLLECKNIVSLDHDMPDFGEMLKGRIKAKTTSKLITPEWCDQVTEMCKRTKTLRQENLIHNDSSISLGDSHTPAFSQLNDVVLRRNGRTLAGSLKKGLTKYIEEYRIRDTNHVNFVLGSIDIRHHVMRDSNPVSYISELLYEYTHQLKEVRQIVKSISIASPVPVEFEARKLPKTGYFEGTPFYGTREQRLEITKIFFEIMEPNFEIVHPPCEWYEMDGEEFANKCMEFGGSVHLSPLCYRRNNWGKL